MLARRLPDKLASVKRASLPPEEIVLRRRRSKPRDPRVDGFAQGPLNRAVRPGDRDGGRVEKIVVDCSFPARLVALFGLALWLVPGPSLAAPASAESSAFVPSPLSKKLDALATRKPLAGARVGMLVVRASDGGVVYARGADELLIPASNQKVLTSLAALSRFGPSHRFKTRIWSRGALGVDGEVASLLIEGGGDPSTNSEDWWRLAADLARKGLLRVREGLVVDDSRFEEPGWHPSWGRISSRAYHAPIGALTANYGNFLVAIGPAKAVGDPAKVRLDPPIEFLTLHNRATTVARGAATRLSVDRAAAAASDGGGIEFVRVDGQAQVGDDVDIVHRSIRDPGLYAGSLFAHQLEANGVHVDGGVSRGLRSGSEWTLLHEHEGARNVADIVSLCMKWSNNAIAEMLLKNLGAWDGANLEEDPSAQGDWPGGVRALRAELAALGIDLGEARLVDGSGLSIQNRLSPRILVQALEVGRETFRIAPEFIASMPIATRDGTLEKRLDGRDSRIRAKTGLLGDAKATSLSGYAERADGELLIFSILVNGFSGSSGGAMDAVDRLAGALVDVPLVAVGAP